MGQEGADGTGGQADGARVPAAAVPRARDVAATRHDGTHARRRDVAAARHDGAHAHGGDVAAARHDGADGHAAPDAGPGPADAVWHVGNPRAGSLLHQTQRDDAALLRLGTMPELAVEPASRGTENRTVVLAVNKEVCPAEKKKKKKKKNTPALNPPLKKKKKKKKS